MKLIQTVTVILLGSSASAESLRALQDLNETTSFSTFPISSITSPVANVTENLFDAQVGTASTVAIAADESLLNATDALEGLVNTTESAVDTLTGMAGNDTGYSNWLDNISGNDYQDGMNHTDNSTDTDTWFADQEGTEWGDIASDDVPTEDVPSDVVPSAATRIVSVSVLAAYTVTAILSL